MSFVKTLKQFIAESKQLKPEVDAERGKMLSDDGEDEGDMGE